MEHIKFRVEKYVFKTSFFKKSTHRRNSFLSCDYFIEIAIKQFSLKLTRSNIKNPLIVCWWRQLWPEHSIFVAIFQISMNLDVIVRTQTNQRCIQLKIATFRQCLVRNVIKVKWGQNDVRCQMRSNMTHGVKWGQILELESVSSEWRVCFNMVVGLV